MTQLFWNAVHAGLGKTEQPCLLREILLELHGNPRDYPLTSFFIPSQGGVASPGSLSSYMKALYPAWPVQAVDHLSGCQLEE